MRHTITAKFETALLRWLWWVSRYAVIVVVLASILVVLSVRYIAGNLGINTDTASLISERLPWRATYLSYKQSFPQYTDTIAVVIDADTPDQLHDAVPRLVHQLQSRPELFESVYSGAFSEFFRTNGFLYLDIDELEDLADRLADVQPLLARLGTDPSTGGLVDILLDVTDALVDGDELQIDGAFDVIAEVFDEHAAGQAKALSWQTLMNPSTSTPETRGLIVVKPVLDFSRLLPGERAVVELRKIAAHIGLTPERGVAVRLTGGAALAYEELHSVMRGAQKAGLLALVMVAVVLSLGLRSITLVLASLLTLMAGLIYTAAFATFAIGELNLISVAFAVLYIGLGVDFAIHYCLRYQEILRSGERPEALEKTTRTVGTSFAICTITTATGFYAFIPTAYSGVAELGLISGTGMFISLFASLTLLPALLKLAPVTVSAKATVNVERRPIRTILSLPTRYPRLVCACSAVLAATGVALLPKASFDHNPIHLQDPTTESVRTYRSLLAEAERSPLSIAVVVPDREEARALAARLAELPEVEEAIMVSDFVATEQERKLTIIEDLLFVMGEDLAVSAAVQDQPPADKLAALRTLHAALSAYVMATPGHSASSAQRLVDALSAFLVVTDSSTPLALADTFARLERALFSNLPGRLAALTHALDAEAFDESSLPQDLRSRWIDRTGAYRIEVLPSENLDDNRALERFVTAVQTIVPERATGGPVINVAASEAVLEAFRQAFGYALIAITLWSLLLLDRPGDVIFILAPLLFAGLLTAATTVLLGLSFNFANIIALPLLLGIGVDSAVHILHRYRHAPPADGMVLGTSTARAVVFSALTTACGFGNLAISSHLGTASMGTMLAFGLGFTLICTLILLPSMLAIFTRQQPQLQ